MSMEDTRDWIASALSAEQKVPLRRKQKNASILSAAGSGKTRTLVHLLLSDLANGIPPASIVAFTFTEKAADELLARIHGIASKKLPHLDLTGLFIGTIHSWCFQYLLDQPEFYNVSSLDELHVDAIVSRLYDLLELEATYGRPYPKGIQYFLADLEIFYNEGLEVSRLPRRIRKSVQTFVSVLRDNHLLTYGGMVDSAWRHLKGKGGLSDLKIVYVDEYQDVNPAQVQLVHSMITASTQIVVVGDDLQCIYNWRGSDVTRILDFTEEFPDSDVYRLSDNYRSRPGIVRAANTVAAHIALRDPEKVMRPQRPEDRCDVVHWLSASSEEEQADAITDIVSRFIKEGVPPPCIAVLLRSVTGSGRPIVDALESAGIPVVCPVLSRAARFIQEFVLPVLDWIRQEHPEPRNELEESKAEEAAEALWEAVSPWIQASDGESVFWDGLNAWLDAVDGKSSSAYDVRGCLYDLMEKCDIGVSSTDSELMVGLGIASQIIRSVEEIHRRRIAGQNRRTPRGIVSEVFFAILRSHEKFGESIPIEKVGDGVFVSTVHQAKGLEWPVVIVPMLRNGKFPVATKPHGTRYPDAIAKRYGTYQDDERRLFYVAVTRAKERLFLIDPEGCRPHRRSIFLDELATDGITPSVSVAKLPVSVWRISKDDLKDTDPPPIRLGLSDVLVYLECPYQFALSRIVNIEPSVGDELGYGKSLHELIQRRLEAKSPWDDAALEDAASRHVMLPLMSETGEAKAKLTIKGRVKDLSNLGLLDATVETEIPVEMIMATGIIQGTVDVVQVEDDGSITVRDWKSSTHEDFARRYESQLRFYAEALRRSGRKVRAADIVDVKASATSRRIVSSPVDIGPEATDNLLSEIEMALASISKGQYPPMPGKIVCRACDMSRICGERCKA